ncbi:MAG TPA: hypothetical protein VHO70_01445, partial [Chitinispirillaceae bacterium]|nr:hypothetical protein [Chitinispirillaceae bacterium]
NNDGDRPVTIGIVDLPHISNYTDFDALRMEPDVSLRIVRTSGDLGNLEALIIPGSKNVPSDMEWLRTSQISAGLIELARKGGTDIAGICGGFQMLGKAIADPYMVESGGGECAGLALLDVCTILGQDKILKRTEAIHTISGHKLSGYEIHHGRTTADAAAVLIVNDKNEPVGVGSADHRIWGTYLHGVFDGDEFRRWFVNRLRKNKGLTPLAVTTCYDIEPALDRLADVFREAVDVKDLYRLMGL